MEKKELFILNYQKMFGMRIKLNKLTQKGYSSDYHYTEIRCIVLIGKMEEPNVTKLSEMLYMTRGGISKTTHKLLRRGAIENYQKADNKKEVYFKLTDIGKAISLEYDEFLITQKERDSVIFSQLSEAEKDTIIIFLEKFNQLLENEMRKIDLPILDDHHHNHHDDKHHDNQKKDLINYNHNHSYEQHHNQESNIDNNENNNI